MALARKIQETPPAATYQGDYYGWLKEQAALLDAGRNAHADWSNIAEALRDLGSEQEHRLESAFRVLLIHLLKWDSQPSRRSRSWQVSIRNNRDVIGRLLKKSGSLRAYREEAVEAVYPLAARQAGVETGMSESTFPTDCPYTFDEMMTRDIPWPQD